jgi:hypothetical protein
VGWKGQNCLSQTHPVPIIDPVVLVSTGKRMANGLAGVMILLNI